MVKWEPPIESVRLGNASVQTRVLADGAVETAKIDNDAVTTPKINNLAVTNAEIANATITKLKIGDQEVDIQRMLDPLWSRHDADSSSNTTITTSDTTYDTVDIAVPTWVGTLRMVVVASAQFSEGTSAQNFTVGLEIDGVDSSATSQTIPNGSTATITVVAIAHVVSPASTITVGNRMWTNNHNNSANGSSIQVLSLGER
jgi:hypothetical protein